MSDRQYMGVKKIRTIDHWYYKNLEFLDSVYNVFDIDVWKMLKYNFIALQGPLDLVNIAFMILTKQSTLKITHLLCMKIHA